MEKKLDMEVKRLAGAITTALAATQRRLREIDKLFSDNHAFHDGNTYKAKITNSKLYPNHEVCFGANSRRDEGTPYWAFQLRQYGSDSYGINCSTLNENYIAEVLPAVECLIVSMLVAAEARLQKVKAANAAADNLFSLAKDGTDKG